MMKTVSLLLILFLAARDIPADMWRLQPRGSANFYFSEGGDDKNDGRSRRTPWRSLGKLAEVGPLEAGDSVLLERGSIFAGPLFIQGKGSEDNGVYVGAYGAGQKPVIRGSVRIDGWERYDENIWVTPCTACDGMPGDLFIDGIAQPLGRYPNGEYLVMKELNSERRTFADSSSSFADHFWDGAEVVVRTSRWTIDRVRADIYQGKAFQFSGALSYEPGTGAGYFLQNHPGTLDREGEWSFDERTRRIFLFTRAGIGERQISASVFNEGMVITKSNHVTVENVVVMHARRTGITVTRSGHVTLRSLDISGSGEDGLQVSSCDRPKVENCIVRDSNNNGVEWKDNVHGEFDGNTILRTGLQPGRGRSGNGTYIAFYATGGDGRPNVIRNNTIDRTGYSAIDFRTSPTTISHNLISNFCLVKDDGGGIYTWNNPHGNNAIEENIILDGIGSGAGTSDPKQLYTSGIYVDDHSRELTITGNTIGFCATAGIFIHNARNIEIEGNNLFGNGGSFTSREKAELLIKSDAAEYALSRTPLNLEVKSNLFTAADESISSIYFSGDLTTPGNFSGNQFRGAKADNTIAVSLTGGGLCDAPETFDLKQWQKATSLEKGSTFTLTDVGYPEVRGPNLISNGNMSNDMTGWLVWPEDATLHRVNALRKGPSLQVRISHGTEALLYHAGFPLDKRKIYCLTFSAKAVAKSTMEFVPLAAALPWNAVGSYSCVTLDTTFRKFTSFFMPEKSIHEARLNFKSNITFWIDEVSLYEVATPVERGKLLRLISGLSASRQDIPIDEAGDLPGNVPGTGQLKPAASDAGP